MSWILSVVASVAVGAALVFVGPFENRCAATFRLAANTDPQQLAFYRGELLNHSWEAMQGGSTEGPGTEQWSVDFPAPQLLRLLCLTTADRETGLARVTNVAEAYLAKMELLGMESRTVPTGAEVVLTQYASRLHARLREIEGRLEAAGVSLPTTDPQEQRETLLNRWESLRSSFASARRQLGEADAEIDRLRSEPEPTHGIVPTEKRRRALEADLTLQQDLRELEVRLSEVKLHLLNVWQESAGRLEQLRLAADQLAGDDTQESTPRAAGDMRQTVEELLTEAGRYRDALAAFAESWTREFTTLRQVKVDPLSSELLDVHERARKLLNDFLFHSGKRLAAMRTLIQRVGDGSADHARYYVLQSDLTRGFQTVQTAHHRFEFAAGALEMSDNFRLDSALRSARGLRRRSQHQIRLIDERLQAKAAQLARKHRMHDLAEAERFIEDVRERADRTIEKLIALQDELNENADRREAFLRANMQRDLIMSRYEQTKRDLTETQEQLRDLAGKRAVVWPTTFGCGGAIMLGSHSADQIETPRLKTWATQPEEAKLELVSCEVLDSPANLPERCRTGGIGALLTFLALALGQWWVTRRV